MENKIEIIENGKENKLYTANLKYGDFQTNFTEPVSSYVFWKEMEEQANRAIFNLKKNTKMSFEFSLKGIMDNLMNTEESKKQRLISHINTKYPSVDCDKLYSILNENIKEILPSGPDDNHPNPFFKFPIESDFIKVFVSSIIEKYNK